MAQTNEEFQLTRSQLKRRHKKWQTAGEGMFENYIALHPDETKLWEISVIKLLAWNYEQCKNPTEVNQDKQPG